MDNRQVMLVAFLGPLPSLTLSLEPQRCLDHSLVPRKSKVALTLVHLLRRAVLLSEHLLNPPILSEELAPSKKALL